LTIDVPVTFRLDRAPLLRLPSRASDEALWNALSHRILRTPHALADHTRRIALCERESMGRHAAGALADLLHVLDGRGRSLAVRQLNRVSARLGQEQHRVLERWATTGRRPDDERDRTLLADLPGRRLPAFAPARPPPDGVALHDGGR